MLNFYDNGSRVICHVTFETLKLEPYIVTTVLSLVGHFANLTTIEDILQNRSDSISIKLDGCKLVPSDNVQYLGVYIDNFVSWDFHIILLSNKLSRANGIISKLRHFTTKETLLSVYYAILYSHMTYGCLVGVRSIVRQLIHGIGSKSLYTSHGIYYI